MASRMLARQRRRRKVRYFYVVEFSNGLYLRSSRLKLLKWALLSVPVEQLENIVACYCTWELPA